MPYRAIVPLWYDKRARKREGNAGHFGVYMLTLHMVDVMNVPFFSTGLLKTKSSPFVCG